MQFMVPILDIQDDGENHKRREKSQCVFLREVVCSGFDRFTANILYTRLEYLIPPLCEEGRPKNKVITYWKACLRS